MSSWSEGYISDIDYTHGYFAEINPQQIIMPFLMAGIAPPKINNACELGFGQGVSLNIHAAASDIKWYGTDFNPNQTLFARTLANKSGKFDDMVIADQSFKEFCHRDDLPQFDYIGLHGIWSWISEENQQIITDFIHRKLNVGGVLYISYNTLPGWSGISPLRHLLVELNQTTSQTNTKENNILQSLEQTKNTLNLSHILTNQIPDLITRTEDLASKNATYLVHEYLNDNWQPLYFSQVKNILEKAKLTFACSTSYLDDYENCLFDKEQQEYLDTIHDPSLKQTIKDYFLNKQFRRDYWVKGARKLTTDEKIALWGELSVMLVANADDIDINISHYQAISINQELLQPILNVLKDKKTHQVSKLLTSLKDKVEPLIIIELLALLISKKDAVLVQDKNTIKNALPYCQKLNRHILQMARNNNNISFIASPVIGGGVHLNHVNQLFTLAHLDGMDEAHWETFVWDILKSQGLALTKNNDTIIEDEGNLEELSNLKASFIKDDLPVLKQLSII